MRIIKFEDLIAWQKGQELAVEIYKNFNGVSDWAFRNQICKAVVSISNNLAEGFDRDSKKEFKYFLSIARASCAEVKSMLYLTSKLGYMKEEITQNMINQSTEISKIINGLMRSLASH